MQQNLRAVSAVSQAIDYIKALPGRKVLVFASRFLLIACPGSPRERLWPMPSRMWWPKRTVMRW